MSTLHESGVRGCDEGTVYRVLTAVAERDRSDPLDLPPLFEAVDPDALERITRNDGVREIAFTYHGYQVVVDGDGEVRVTGE